VLFTNGLGTATGITLYDQIASVTLTATTSSPSLTGSTSFAVNGAAPTSMALASCVVLGASTPCLTGVSPTYNLGTAFGGTLVANVQMLDQWGNAATISTAIHVTVTSSSSTNFRVTYSSGTFLNVAGTNSNMSVNTFTVQKRVTSPPTVSATITLQVTSGAAGIPNLTFGTTG
jgi:hypothetical protein